MHVNVLNVLTGLRLRLYSSGMTVEFNLLAEKISQLAEMAQTLRRENADLRRSVAAVAAENADLSQRMDSAHERVTALLAQMRMQTKRSTSSLKRWQRCAAGTAHLG